MDDFLKKLSSLLFGKPNRDAEIAREQKPDFSHFPYELILVSGQNAVKEWHALKLAGRGIPVIIGSADEVEMLAEGFHPDHGWHVEGTTQEILDRAAKLTHPQSMVALKDEFIAHLAKAATERDENSESDDPLRMALDQMKEQLLEGNYSPQQDEELMGEWENPEGQSAPATEFVPLSLTDYETGALYKQVYIALIPTNDMAEIPAYLSYGGWNSCPPPEYHVAALRAWKQRYGADLVIASHDTLEMHVTKRPATRKDATALALEQFDYCEDIVTQGVGTINGLAAALITSNSWFYWWD